MKVYILHAHSGAHVSLPGAGLSHKSKVGTKKGQFTYQMALGKIRDGWCHPSPIKSALNQFIQWKCGSPSQNCRPTVHRAQELSGAA